MASDRITVRVPDQLAEDLQRFVVMSGKAESTVIREALTQYLEAHGQLPSCYELLVKSKVLGSMQGLPPDLSSNQSHMDGFGRE